MSKSKLNIGIAGAGIAGLVAGTELQRAGHQVSIFESSSRTGGRIQSMEVGGLLVESGPEFIHGNQKETLGLLKKYHIKYDLINGKMYSARDGALRETYEMAEGWDQLLDKMNSLERDQPFQEFLEKSFMGNHFKELKKSAIRFAEGFDLADTSEASTKALLAEWKHEEAGQYRIPAGYGTLTFSIENEFKNLTGKIFLNHGVESVEWNSGGLRISVNGHKIFNMDKLIISLPLSLLNKTAPPLESIVFRPSLEEKQKAF
ncbi:MAG TPA: FAD-dependent oxidoreductase, partial [Puia sp.]